MDWLLSSLSSIHEIIKEFMGLDVSPGSPTRNKDTLTLATAGFTVLVAGKSAYLWLGRRLGKRGFLPDEHLALKAEVVDEVREKLRNDLQEVALAIGDRIDETSQKSKTAISAVFRRKISEIKSLAEPKDVPESITADGSSTASRMPRAELIALIKETILHNFWSGNYFEESGEYRHVFITKFEDATRHEVKIRLQTPYYQPESGEADYPYHLMIWHKNRKQLELGWDPVGDTRIIGQLRRGDWETAVLSWNTSQGRIPTIESEDQQILTTQTMPRRAV